MCCVVVFFECLSSYNSTMRSSIRSHFQTPDTFMAPRGQMPNIFSQLTRGNKYGASPYRWNISRHIRSDRSVSQLCYYRIIAVTGNTYDRLYYRSCSSTRAFCVAAGLIFDIHSIAFMTARSSVLSNIPFSLWHSKIVVRRRGYEVVFPLAPKNGCMETGIRILFFATILG